MLSFSRSRIGWEGWKGWCVRPFSLPSLRQDFPPLASIVKQKPEQGKQWRKITNLPQPNASTAPTAPPVAEKPRRKKFFPGRGKIPII